MFLPVFLFYCYIVALIRIYKWWELQFLKIINPVLKWKAKQIAESIGVVLHCPGDEEWSKSENKRVLGICPKYRTLVHIKVLDNKVFARVANKASLGLAEAYMEKMWDFVESEEDITDLVKRLAENRVADLYYHRWNKFLEWVELYAFNLQTKKRAAKCLSLFDSGPYDSLFKKVLDPTSLYSCAYYRDSADLASAQRAKMDLLARKLDLKAGMRVLDIGCGSGALCKFLAEAYEVDCVGISLGKEGIQQAKDNCKGQPIEFRVQDYRDLTGNDKFDRIVCVEMFEQVGVKNYTKFFEIVERNLTDDGIFILHTAGLQYNNYHARSEPFCHKYITPNAQYPTIGNIARATKHSFVVEDWHNIGQDYAQTFNQWRANFLNGFSQLENEKYDDKFYRMFIFYLCFARAIFSSRTGQVWQIVFSKKGLKNNYRAAR